MADAPWGLALAAGMLAAVNPCGFALLPAYLSFLVAGDDTPRRGQAMARALSATAAMTAGFAAVFGAFGLLIAPVASQIQRNLPWVTIGIGVVLAGLGGWLLAGRDLPGFRLRGVGGPALARNAVSMAGFGAAYAVASLSCTIGPFLAIVVTNFRAGSIVDGVSLYLAYAAGMGLTVAVAALAVSLARDTLVGRLRRAGPAITRAGGLLLIIAGGYVAYYGWWETRIRTGATTADPVIEAAATIQRWLASGLERAGITTFAVVFAMLLGTTVTIAWLTRQRKAQPGRRG